MLDLIPNNLRIHDKKTTLSFLFFSSFFVLHPDRKVYSRKRGTFTSKGG